MLSRHRSCDSCPAPTTICSFDWRLIWPNNGHIVRLEPSSMLSAQQQEDKQFLRSSFAPRTQIERALMLLSFSRYYRGRVPATHMTQPSPTVIAARIPCEPPGPRCLSNWPLLRFATNSWRCAHNPSHEPGFRTPPAVKNTTHNYPRCCPSS